jgi:hypothetical protein
MDKECLICKTIFNVKPSHFNRRVCCSKECQSKQFKTQLIGEANPNYKNAKTKEFTCITCGNLFKRKTYGILKTCSIECNLKNRSKIHTGKIIFNKRQKTHLTYDKIVCNCGNKKDVKAKKCINCYKKFIKRNIVICKICKNEFVPKSSKVQFCSKECQKINCKNITKSDKNPNWKGGIGSINQIERRTDKFKQWRISVFERDKYTCQDCGKIGGTLHAHHILPFAKYKELRFEITNGKTLCIKCHKTYHPSMNFKTNLL